MAVVWLTAGKEAFPPAYKADREGLVAVGGRLCTETLLMAYRQGIFPWYSAGEPVMWWSLDPRAVLRPAALHVPRSLDKVIRKGAYTITVDRAFERVMRACAAVPRPGQRGTWIQDVMVSAYVELHARGHAHSVEAWRGDELVGGFYGVSVGQLFCGESMFATAPDASKVAFATFTRRLAALGWPLIDCQMMTPHLQRFGAELMPRSAFLERVADLREREPIRGAFAPFKG